MKTKCVPQHLPKLIICCCWVVDCVAAAVFAIAVAVSAAVAEAYAVDEINEAAPRLAYQSQN